MAHSLPENTVSSSTYSTYHVGDIVPESGFYICVPCGYKRQLRKRSYFPPCVKCLGKNHDFTRGLELWEKVDAE